MNATIAAPHGIVFVLDPSNRRTIVPTYEPGSVTASNATCVSVATLHVNVG